MAKAKQPEKKASVPGKRALYQVKDGKIARARRACPKCGPGIFLAQHKDREACGNCGYTEFKAKAA